MYRLSESEKKQTEKLVDAVRDTVKSTDVSSVYKRGLIKKKKFNKRVSKARNALKSLNIDIDYHAKKIKEKCEDFSIVGIVKTISEYWENAKERENIPEVQNKTIVLGLMVCILPVLVGEWILSFGLGKATADMIGTVLFAPIFEELAKYLSIKQGVHQEFWKFFNTAEFIGYVVKPAIIFIIAPSVVTFTVFGFSLIARFICVMMHTVNTMIQKKELDSSNTKRGYIIGVLIHIFWNGVLANIGAKAATLGEFITGEFLWAGSALSFLLLIGVIYKKLIAKEPETGVEPAYA